MNVLRELWKDKPLFIAVVAGVVIVVYILIKNSQQAMQASMSANSSTPAAGSNAYGTGTFVEYSYYNNQPVSNNPAPTSAPTIVTAASTVQSSPTTFPTPVLRATPVVQPLPTATSTPPPARTYTVVRGDTLSGIAARFGTTWQNLFNLNQSTIVSTSNRYGNPIGGGPQNNIFPGEVLSY